jgi:heat shock protein HtpX
MQRMKTAMLMAALTVLMMILGDALGGRSAMLGFFGLALAMNFFSYWFSDKIVLRMYHAREVTDAEAPELCSIVRELSAKAGLPMPRVYIIPSATPNAFATGRDPAHAAVAATEGILRMLNRDELAGVMGHELSHVRHRDILVSTVASVMAAAISYMAYAFMFVGGRDDDDSNPLVALAAMILAPIGAALIQMAISRSREYMADEGGAKLSGNPLSLASALKKLSMGVEMVPMQGGNPATSSMFIVNPFSAKGMAGLFSTHPPMEERVARLEQMAHGGRV